MTVPNSPNSYITKKLNNMDKAKTFKNKQDDWTRLYHKTLKGLEAIIDVQRQMQDMMKIAEETNMTITEIEGIILKASINNRTMNAMNILGILEDLQYLIQSNMEDQTYQIQRMLADELDAYKEQGNQYVDNNIWKIQELYKDMEQKRELNKGRIEKEVILIKPYEVSESAIINNEVDNLIKYMMFICSPTQTILFKPPPYYQSL